MRSSLLKSNPYLRDPETRQLALRVSAASSSAVEGIHKPFAAAPAESGVKPALRKRAKSAG